MCASDRKCVGCEVIDRPEVDVVGVGAVLQVGLPAAALAVLSGTVTRTDEQTTTSDDV